MTHPTDYVLVPREATEAMQEAASKFYCGTISKEEFGTLWQLMLAASPAPAVAGMDRVRERAAESVRGPLEAALISRGIVIDSMRASVQPLAERLANIALNAALPLALAAKDEALSKHPCLCDICLNVREDGIERAYKSKSARIAELEAALKLAYVELFTISKWRKDADAYDKDMDHPNRVYCEDVEMIEQSAALSILRIDAVLAPPQPAETARTES